MSTPTEAVSSCEACRRPLEQTAYYAMEGDAGERANCLRCALKNRALLARSARVAVVVGTVLALLNQGDRLFGGEPLPGDLWWKIPLTYCVPFAVATYGALGNARREQEL